ncbi:MAG: hypothetical protein ACOZF2_03375 [Thermodesulfobacteriota bacterium]
MNAAGGNILKLFLSLNVLLLFVPLSFYLEHFRPQGPMLLLVSVAIIIPALFHFLRPAEIAVNEAAIGSSTQVALFVTPFLVFLSYLIAPRQMDLVFTRGEVFAIVISASLVAHTTSDGKSNWFTGLLLLTVYLVMAVAFFHVPG